MKLRKFLAISAAVVTAGIMTVQASPAQASNPGGVINHVAVGATDPIAANVPVSGIFKSGTATFAGFTAGCTTGTVAGNLTPTGAFSFTTLNITCASPLGVDAVITLGSGCKVTGPDPRGTDDVHVGLGAGQADGPDPKGGKFDPVELGRYTVANQCAVVTIAGGCSFRVQGGIDLQFNEVPKTVSGVQYQDLILKGNALTTSNATALCFGLIPNGSAITLNNITFNLRTTGTPAPGLIDYHPAH